MSKIVKLFLGELEMIIVERALPTVNTKGEFTILFGSVRGERENKTDIQVGYEKIYKMRMDAKVDDVDATESAQFECQGTLIGAPLIIMTYKYYKYQHAYQLIFKEYVENEEKNCFTLPLYWPRGNTRPKDVAPYV